jgi:signal transduction histidine kinase
MGEMLRTSLRAWLQPVLITAGVWAWIGWLHPGGVGRPDDVPPLVDARFEVMEGEDGGAATVDLRLPHDWADTHPFAETGRYTLRARLGEVPAEGLGLYFPSVNTRRVVRLNGELLDAGQKFHQLTTHYWHIPSYVSVPAALLRVGENVIEIELDPEALGGGYLAPPFLGADSLVRPSYEVRLFLQRTGIQILVVAMVALGMFLALLYLLRRKDSSYFAFALVTWVFAFPFYNVIAIDAWLPKPNYRWSGAVTMAWLAVAIAAFVHRFLGIRRPGLEWGLAAGALLGSIYFALALEERHFAVAVSAWGALTLAVGLYPVVLVVRRFVKDPTPELQLVVATGLVIITTSVHDILLVNGPVSLEHDFAIVWAAVVSTSIFAFLFVKRFIVAFDTSEALTAELEQRVAEKHAELENSYRTLRKLEEERAVATERERLMAEIHDGMGGQLVSTLAMVQDGAAQPAEVEAALRAALDDMRLVIHSLDAADTDLPTLLGMLRGRLAPQLERAGIRVRWQVEDVPPLRDFGPEAALHLMRIVQESVTNVVKHAGAETLTVATGVEDGHVFVSLADDGRGLGGESAPGEGRGVGNMRRRARALGGELELRPCDPGTEVRVRLPLGPDVRPGG